MADCDPGIIRLARPLRVALSCELPVASEISVLAELEHYQIAYHWAGEDEVKIACPFHSDVEPSCNVNIHKRYFNCHAASCGRHGDIITLLAGFMKTTRSVIMEELSTRYELDDTKIVEPDVVERWHEDIWRAEPLLAELRKRAVSDDVIKRRKLGTHNGRVTIPVPNSSGDWVNVRQYLPGAPGDQKMRNMRGRGAVRWYPIDQLKYQAIVLCGGELKSLVAGEQLNKHGFGCIWPTQGEKLIPPNLLRDLAGKEVYVCLDIDKGGRTATEQLCRSLHPLASQLCDIVLPLDIDRFPKGDINDFVAQGGELLPLLEKAELWAPSEANKFEETDPEVIHLSQAANARYAGKRVAITGIPTQMDTAPFVVPKDVTVKCDKSLKECPICPVWPSMDGKFTVHTESPAILEMVSAPKRVIHDALVGAVGIPRSCRVCSFEATSYYNCEDTRLSPQLEITERAADQKLQPAICVGEGLQLNEPYKLVGRMYPHPATQQSTLLISKYEQTRDALSTYAPTSEELAVLDVFRPAKWSPDAIQTRLDDLYSDLELHVTRIWRRRDMHLAIDLAYHSPLLLWLDGHAEKGWTEVLIVGDSAHGKTEASKKMMTHYGLGERIECKNATVAGLLGGLQQTGTRWFASWGILPTHDKRLVILEELKGAPVEVISKLTDMRSSGIAELSKILKQRTHARTRILAISNPRFDRDIASYGYGIEAIKELIGGLEDVRRFDMCLIVAKSEVDANEINEMHGTPNGVPGKYTGELCRALILWAWTRNPSQCVVTPDVAAVIRSESTRLAGLFTDQIPVVDRGSMRLKLMRLSASLAARTFSTNDDRQSLALRDCHVRYMSQYLERVYSTPAFGYREFTQAVSSVEDLMDPQTIVAQLQALPFPYDFIESLLRTERIEQQDLQDWTGWDRVQSSTLLSLLVRKRALKRDGRNYRKTGSFIVFLRELLEKRSFPDRPDHLPETGEF